MPNRIDILDDVIDRADAELFTFVQPTELALVPRAISGDSEHQALRFTRWPDRAEFKTMVIFIHCIGSHNMPEVMNQGGHALRGTPSIDKINHEQGVCLLPICSDTMARWCGVETAWNMA